MLSDAAEALLWSGRPDRALEPAPRDTTGGDAERAPLTYPPLVRAWAFLELGRQPAGVDRAAEDPLPAAAGKSWAALSSG